MNEEPSEPKNTEPTIVDETPSFEQQPATRKSAHKRDSLPNIRYCSRCYKF